MKVRDLIAWLLSKEEFAEREFGVFVDTTEEDEEVISRSTGTAWRPLAWSEIGLNPNTTCHI